jgi:large subunit ribosomal protein L4
MARAKVYDFKGDFKGSMDLPDDLFSTPVNKAVLYDAVRMYQANRRSGSAKAKGRSEVNYSGSKPYRQKGTGRARSGTRRSPIWRGGGVTFGPKPRNYRYSINKKMKRTALLSALSDKSNSENIVVVEDISIDTPKTKTFVDFLKASGLEGKRVLFVSDTFDDNTYRSMRNIAGVDFILARSLNAYEILRTETLLFTRKAIDSLQEVFC